MEFDIVSYLMGQAAGGGGAAYSTGEETIEDIINITVSAEEVTA